jgi:hypothetical protein
MALKMLSQNKSEQFWFFFFSQKHHHAAHIINFIQVVAVLLLVSQGSWLREG